MPPRYVGLPLQKLGYLPLPMLTLTRQPLASPIVPLPGRRGERSGLEGIVAKRLLQTASERDAGGKELDLHSGRWKREADEYSLR
jgi:hypothetical protein